MAVSHIIEALGDTVDFEYQGDTSQLFRGIGITTKAGDVRRRFWAMREPDWFRSRSDPYNSSSSDPHVDINHALSNGAAGIICNTSYKGHPALEGRNVFFTPDTLEFVRKLVEVQRQLSPGRQTIAVTGSAGKTTTCAMMAHALLGADETRTVLHTNRSLNLLPRILAQQSRSHRFSNTVLEVAGSVFAYKHLEFSVSADVAVVTSISEAHLDYLGDLAGVARYKSGIFKRPPPDGAAVINIDAPHSDILISRAADEGARVVTYGENPKADIRLVDYDPIQSRVQVDVEGLEAEYLLGPRGKHMALNSLAVLATLRDLGLDWAAGVASLSSFAAPDGRGGEVPLPLDSGGEFTLVDGSFNANPDSIRASLQSLSGSHPTGRRIAVLGDILELGAHADEVHQSLAHEIRGSGIDALHLIGEHFHRLHATDPDLAPEVHRWEDIDDLIVQLPQTLKDGDLVLVKGSAGTGLKKLVAALMQRAAAH